MTGHCQHCDPERLDCHDVGGDIGWVHASSAGAVMNFKAQWVSGHCPMCAVTLQHVEDIEAHIDGLIRAVNAMDFVRYGITEPDPIDEETAAIIEGLKQAIEVIRED